MRVFFKGCRRKIGLVTLVMACVFAMEWVRSLTTIDIGTLCLIHSHVVGITSSERGIEFHYERNTPEITSYASGWYSSIRVNVSDESLESILQDEMLGYYWDTPVSPIPYSSIVAPLILLSAYLLLSKSRSHAPKMGESAPSTRERDA